MGVFSERAKPRGVQESRSTFVVPIGSSADDGYAGVNTSLAETSLQSIAVRSAVDLIASLVSELPIDVFSGSGADRTERPKPGYLLDPAGDGAGLEDWAYQVMMSWLLRGNLYGEILAKSRSGYITQASLFYPDDVTGTLDGNGQVRWMVNGKDISASRLLHRRVNPVPGRVLGLSPIAFHASTIGLTLTTTRFGNQWFRDGAHPGGLLTNSEADLTPEQAATAKARFLASLRGVREPAVLGKGWEYKQIQVAPEESQFLETQGFSEAQCARIFGPGIPEVLGYDSGGSMTYANVVDRRADVLVFSLNKWLNRYERLLTAMLPAPQYVKVNRDALLQSTTLERYKAYAIAASNQWKTVNEIRDDEDMPPVSWGDQPNQKTAPAPTDQNPGDGGDGNPA